MNQYPIVSILMTSYNREKYIGKAIESVLNSSFSDFELIIVDDASNDTTVDIANQYAKTDNRISVYVNQINLGDYANRNRAASFARGKYLKYLDSDDLIYPYTLSLMVDVMEAHLTAALALSYNVIDDIMPYPRLYQPEETVKLEYLGNSILRVGPSASIIRKDCFNELCGFSGKQYFGDHELWLRISNKYPIITLPPSLVWWRRHIDQQAIYEAKQWKPIVDRYMLSYDYLMKNKIFFNLEEFAMAKRKIIRDYIKLVLITGIKRGQLKKAFYLFKNGGLKLSDFLNVL